MWTLLYKAKFDQERLVEFGYFVSFKGANKFSETLAIYRKYLISENPGFGSVEVDLWAINGNGAASKVTRLNDVLLASSETSTAPLSFEPVAVRRTTLTSSIETEQNPEWCRTKEIPEWLRTYYGIEESATDISVHSPFAVCGLFQIPEYAAAIARSVDIVPRGDEYADRMVNLRKQRQRRVNNGEVAIAAIQSEFSLRLKMGSNAIMAQQMRKLIDVSELPNVTLQVIPFDTGQYEALRIGAYAEFFLSSQPLPVVHVEDYSSGRYINQADEISHFMAAFKHAQGLALSPDESRKFIADIGREWEMADRKKPATSTI